jgi:hypothetical protein
MANITITPSSFTLPSGAKAQTCLAGTTITAGQACCLVSGSLYPASSNTSSKKFVTGIAMNGGTMGQAIVVQIIGTFIPGGTVVKDTVYVLSETAGDICPYSDLTTGDEIVIVGVASSTTAINLNLWDSGIAHS